MSAPRSSQPVLWFALSAILVVALISTNRPSPSPYYPVRQHSVLGEVGAWVIDLFVGGPRRFRSNAEIPEMQCLAGSIENMDRPTQVEGVRHNEGW